MNHKKFIGKDVMKEKVVFFFENEKLYGLKGDSIASALIRNGIFIFSYGRKTKRPRGYTCSVDFCNGTCMMIVNEIENVKTCETRLEASMRVERMKWLNHE